MNLYELRKAAIASFRPLFPAVVAVEPHGGRFDFDDLQHYGVKGTELRVAILNARRVDSGRAPYADCLFAIYIIAGSQLSDPVKPRNTSELGLEFGSFLLSWLSNNTPGENGRAPEQIAWQNLYSSDVRDVGRHLSVVTWRQMVELTAATDTSALQNFLTFAGDIDATPADGRPEAAVTVSLPAAEVSP